MNDLVGKNVLITGSTGGIGEAILKKFCELGSNVLATGTNENKLNQLKKDYKNIQTIKFNISNHKDIENFMNDCAKIFNNKIDILINNAGINRDNLSLRMNLEEWNDVININLTSTFLISKFAIKRMLKIKKGKIVNITSIVGHTGNIGQSNYAASKGGIVSMTKSLSLEYAKKNININCISPGFIDTQMTQKIDQKFKEILIDKIPMQRLGKPKDIANATVFFYPQIYQII